MSRALSVTLSPSSKATKKAHAKARRYFFNRRFAQINADFEWGVSDQEMLRFIASFVGNFVESYRESSCEGAKARRMGTANPRQCTPMNAKFGVSGWSKTSVPIKSGFKCGFKWVLRAYTLSPHLVSTLCRIRFVSTLCPYALSEEQAAAVSQTRQWQQACFFNREMREIGEKRQRRAPSQPRATP